jgi:hypothetical protein
VYTGLLSGGRNGSVFLQYIVVSPDWSKCETTLINRKTVSAQAIQHYIKKATLLPPAKSEASGYEATQHLSAKKLTISVRSRYYCQIVFNIMFLEPYFLPY